MNSWRILESLSLLGSAVLSSEEKLPWWLVFAPSACLLLGSSIFLFEYLAKRRRYKQVINVLLRVSRDRWPAGLLTFFAEEEGYCFNVPGLSAQEKFRRLENLIHAWARSYPQDFWQWAWANHELIDWY